MSKVIGAGFDFSETMSFFPLGLAVLVASSSVTSGVFGAWQQFAADIGNDDIYLEYLLSLVGTQNISRYQIGVGAGGSEVVITDNVIFSDYVIEQHVHLLLGKTKVPANSRLALRVTDDEAIANPYNVFVHYSKR